MAIKDGTPVSPSEVEYYIKSVANPVWPIPKLDDPVRNARAEEMAKSSGMLDVYEAAIAAGRIVLHKDSSQ